MSRKSPQSRIEYNGERVSIGYTCVCGERVTVYRLASGDELPPIRTVSCSKGHVAVFTPQQFAFLDDWTN